MCGESLPAANLILPSCIVYTDSIERDRSLATQVHHYIAWDQEHPKTCGFIRSIEYDKECLNKLHVTPGLSWRIEFERLSRGSTPDDLKRLINPVGVVNH